MKKTRKISKSPRRANRPAANNGSGMSYGTEIGAVVAIGIVAVLGVVLWRGRESLPQLRLPAPEDVRDTVRDSWKSAKKSTASAMDRLPHIEPDMLAEVSRGFDALKQFFSRAA